jgi:YD repeat-containing protein
MKRKLNFPLFCLLMMLLVSTGCKKESGKKERCRITKLIKNGTEEYNIKYGDNEKISSIELTPGTEKHAYAYNGDKVTITVTENGNFQHRWIVTTNKNDFATNVLLENNQSGSDWFNQAFTYEGTRVTSNKATDSGGNDSATANYIWENGNPAVLINEGDVFNYEYYTDKNYQPGDWRYIQQLLVGYKIYEYKNLFQSSEINGNKTYYTYNFDDAGRITEATSTSDNITTTFKIEYDCN